MLLWFWFDLLSAKSLSTYLTICRHKHIEYWMLPAFIRRTFNIVAYLPDSVSLTISFTQSPLHIHVWLNTVIKKMPPISYCWTFHAFRLILINSFRPLIRSFQSLTKAGSVCINSRARCANACLQNTPIPLNPRGRVCPGYGAGWDRGAVNSEALCAIIMPSFQC